MSNCGRAKASPQTNLDVGGHQKVGTFLAFLCSSNWNEWYVRKRQSKGPGVEVKVCGMGRVNFHVNSKRNFPKRMSRPAFTCTSNDERKG